MESVPDDNYFKKLNKRIKEDEKIYFKNKFTA